MYFVFSDTDQQNYVFCVQWLGLAKLYSFCLVAGTIKIMYVVFNSKDYQNMQFVFSDSERQIIIYFVLSAGLVKLCSLCLYRQRLGTLRLNSSHCANISLIPKVDLRPELYLLKERLNGQRLNFILKKKQEVSTLTPKDGKSTTQRALLIVRGMSGLDTALSRICGITLTNIPNRT